MGYQTEIAKTIVDSEGDYLLSVKDNQPTFRQDIETTFAEAADARRRSRDELPRPVVEIFENVDKGHGRLETRTVAVTRERTVLATGKTSLETAYYVGSDASMGAEAAGKLIRRHWSIENELHWVLDIAFREDEARHRAGNAAENMTTMRHFSLNIIERDGNRKLGVASSRKRAGWDRNYLIELLTTAEG